MANDYHPAATALEIHRPYRWTPADAAARVAIDVAAANADDVGCLAWQADDNSAWTAIATGTGAAKWARVVQPATGALPGTMSAADFTKLAALPATAPPTTLTLTAGAGMTGGGDLSANRTFDVVANADGSIVANANDVQVGVLATDAQHGNRGGGGIHADVVAAGASGFMTGADKTKLDGVATGAQVCSAANVLTALAACAADVAINTHKLTGLVAGTATGHATEYDQVRAMVATGATDNAILRADGTGGHTTQASGCTIDDSDNVTVPGYALVKNTKITVAGASPYTVLATDQYVHVDTTGGAYTINLPAPSAKGRYYIFDYKFNAATNNITVVRNGSEKIHGLAASYVIANSGGGGWLYSDGTDWYWEQ